MTSVGTQTRRATIQPTTHAVEPNAFETEFGPAHPFYCGSKRPPRGRPYGTPNQCFRRGLKSGFAAAIDKGNKAVRLERIKSAKQRIEMEAQTREKFSRTKARIKQASTAGQAAATAREKARSKEEKAALMNRIQNEGLTALKADLHIGPLSKDEARNLVVRERNRDANFHALTTGYSRAGVGIDQLKQWLLTIGYQM